MKRGIYLVLSLLLVSCVSHKLTVHGVTSEEQFQQAFLLRIFNSEATAVWVCYTEVDEFVLQAVSCQNDTALPLFSAGLQDNGEFDYALISRRLMVISPENTVAYLKMVLYPDHSINDSEVTIQHQARHKLISDPKNKLELQVSRL
jgi:hypothetical protein